MRWRPACVGARARMVWIGAIGEDAFEKPFNAIPYYFFWGIVLSISYRLSKARREMDSSSDNVSESFSGEDRTTGGLRVARWSEP